MPMSNGSPIDQALAEAAERIRRDGYQQGWRDAVAALNKAAAEAADVGPGEGQSELELNSGRPATGVTGLTQGSTPWYVWQAVSKKPGMTGSEIVSVVQDGGHRVSDGSIRTSLARLKERKHLVSRHGKWFLA
jgi:hypothetical protein